MQAPFADPLLQLDIHTRTLPLVDRTTEMQVIRFLLNTVLLDLPTGARALTITGETGVGKSRLLAEMYAEARTLGFRVLEGRIYAGGNTFPYFPFIEVLRPVLRSSTSGQLRRYMGLAVPTADVSARDTASHLPTDVDRRASTDTQRDETEDISLVGLPLVGALANLFPELPGILNVTVMPEVLTPDQQKFRLLDAIATFLERIAREQPVLLSIDGLQWADSASFELTLYLSVRLHKSRVALVGATRPLSVPITSIEASDEAGVTTANKASVQALSELMRQGLLLVLPLNPLDAVSASQHLHALLPGALPENLAQALLARAEGNPFFLEELVRTLTLNRRLVQRGGVWQSTTRTLSAELPGSIILAVGQRLHELSTPCREMLRVAALFGRSFPLAALLQVLAERGENTVLAAVGEAAQANIIAIAPANISHEDDWQEPDIDDEDNGQLAASQPETFIFNHGIVQEVLSAELQPRRANALHAAIGAALEKAYSSTASAHAVELARHYLLGDNKAAAVHWSLLAGEDAAQKQAHREAIGHFRQVLRLIESGETSAQTPSVPQLLITIGDLWFRLGELEQAAKTFQHALERLREPVGVQFTAPSSASSSTPPSSSPLQLAHANRLLADVYRMQGKYDLAMAHLQATCAALETDVEEESAAVSQRSESVPWFPGRSFSDRRKGLTLKRANTTERLLYLQARATLDILLNRRQEAESALWQSHQLATAIGDRGSQAFALHLVGWLRGWGEHIRDAIRLQEQAREIYIAIGDPFRSALGDQGLGIIYQGLGETERASLYTLRGLERARRYAVRYSLGWLYWNSGTIALTRGDWAASASHFQEAMHEAEATNNGRLKPITLQAQAELAFRQGNWQQAERLFQESLQAGLNTEWYPSTLALYGHFLAVTGRRAAARTQLDRASDHPEPPGYGGDFYIPFLAEGYVHLAANAKAAAYVERIRTLRGFMYYGSSVDRILGVVAAQLEQWDLAEQAFEDGLALCRRAGNQPEEAAILYEQARTLLMQSAAQHGQRQRQILQRVHKLCDQSRNLFLQYTMQRSVNLVDTFQDGVRQLERRQVPGAPSQASKPPQSIQTQPSTHAWENAHSEYQLDLNLTRREQEVLRLVAEGHTDREVAEILVLSPRTVNRHLSNIFVKLDVSGRAAAVAYAIRQGMV